MIIPNIWENIKCSKPPISIYMSYANSLFVWTKANKSVYIYHMKTEFKCKTNTDRVSLCIKPRNSNNMCVVSSPLAAETTNCNLSRQTLRMRKVCETYSNTCNVYNNLFATSDNFHISMRNREKSMTDWWFDPPLKNISQLESLFPIYGEQKGSKPWTSYIQLYRLVI